MRRRRRKREEEVVKEEEEEKEGKKEDKGEQEKMGRSTLEKLGAHECGQKRPQHFGPVPLCHQ